MNASLQKESEENGLVILKILIDLFKNYRDQLEDMALEFMHIVLRMYENLPQVVDDCLEKNVKVSDSMHSFRVLTECPIIVVLLFQIYKQTLPEIVPRFVPLIIQTLQVNDKFQTDYQQECEKNGTECYGFNPDMPNKEGFADFFATQV